MATRTDRDGEEYLVIRTKDQRGALLHRAYNVNDLKELAGIVLTERGETIENLKSIIREVLNEKPRASDGLNEVMLQIKETLREFKSRPGDVTVNPPAKKEKKDAKPKPGKPKT